MASSVRIAAAPLKRQWRAGTTILSRSLTAANSPTMGVVSCINYSPRRTLFFGALSRSPFVMDKITIKVPTMGDSITEGTIVEWTAEIGQGVKEGDVVALVETDKVTVDIKAEVDGVIVAHYGAIDDTIEVGSDLYQIDTEASPEIIKSASPAATATDESSPAPPSPAEVKTVAATPATRSPSLKFLGKDGWASRLSAAPVVSVFDLHPMYGRPLVSEDEMEALMSGGANLISE